MDLDLMAITAPLLLERAPIQASPVWVPDPPVLKVCPLATPLCTTDPLARPDLLATLLDHRCPGRLEEEEFQEYLEDPQDLPHMTHTQTHECQEVGRYPPQTASPMEYQDREANHPTRSTWALTTLCSL